VSLSLSWSIWGAGGAIVRNRAEFVHERTRSFCFDLRVFVRQGVGLANAVADKKSKIPGSEIRGTQNPSPEGRGRGGVGLTL
jgi:hypothetical protein